MPVNGALGEPRGQRDFVERRELESSLGEQLQAGGDQEAARFRFAPLMNDSHEYLGYSPGPTAQV